MKAQQEQINQQQKMITTLVESLGRLSSQAPRADYSRADYSRGRSGGNRGGRRYGRRYGQQSDRREEESTPPNGASGQATGDIGSIQTNASSKALMSNIAGPRPTVAAKFAGVEVQCLVDTGSMVSTISEQFFRDWIQTEDGRSVLQPVEWLKVRAANGLEVPYVGLAHLIAQS